MDSPVLSKTNSDPVARIDELLDRDEHRAAWAKMSGLVLSAPTSANCHAVSASATRLDARRADLVALRVAILSNFTVDPIAPVLTARALPSRLLVEPWIAGYDTWRQEIVDPSSDLRGRNPDVIVLALDLENLIPALTVDFLESPHEQIRQQINDVVAEIGDVLQTLRSWSSAKVLMHSFPLPVHRALGVYDPLTSAGQTAATQSINEKLAAAVQSIGNGFVVDMDRLVTSVGAAQWTDRRMMLLAKMSLTQTALNAIADEYLRYFRAFSGVVRKVLVMDLDNTLWGGILGEDGLDGIQLGDAYPGNAFVELQKVILGFHRRGVVLAINSKNNPEDVVEVLERHPSMILRAEHFAAIRVNWQDKLTNMQDLADELGLGIDSFVFIDDSDAECQRLRQALPEVLTIQLSGEPAARAETFRRLGVFDTLSFSQEDRQRGALYRREVQRTQLRKSMQSIEDFYRSLEMEMFFVPIDPSNLARAAELTQRTNQFNLTTQRYTRDSLSALISGGAEAYGFRLTDRFGDNGMIALAILETAAQKTTITSLLMSCRVLKRTVEDAILAFLTNRAAELGSSSIEGLYRPTKKNSLVADLYQTHGFTEARQDGETRVFTRPTAQSLESPEWIRVRAETRSPA